MFSIFEESLVICIKSRIVHNVWNRVSFQHDIMSRLSRRRTGAKLLIRRRRPRHQTSNLITCQSLSFAAVVSSLRSVLIGIEQLRQASLLLPEAALTWPYLTPASKCVLYSARLFMGGSCWTQPTNPPPPTARTPENIIYEFTNSLGYWTLHRRQRQKLEIVGSTFIVFIRWSLADLFLWLFSDWIFDW